jgi:hypothetical protein
MPTSTALDSHHFKAGFHPKCPHCKGIDIKVSLSEHLWGPCNGQYEVVYCANSSCHVFLAAIPAYVGNLRKDVKEADKL